MLKREQLHHYQNTAVDIIKDKKKVALWLPMGMGKTTSTATAIVDLMGEGKIKKTLIIAPLRVAASVWHEEFENWEHLKHINYSHILGSEKKRLEGLNKEADVYIINRENVVWLVRDLLNRKTKMFDTIVIDESDSFKSSNSQRFKALRKLAIHMNYLIELTGTPSPNGYLDIWSQLKLLDDGERLGKTMGKYKVRYFTQDYMGFNWDIKAGAEREIKSKIKDIVYSSKPVVETKRIDIIRDAELPPKLMKQYKGLEKDFLMELESAEIEALSSAALANKLQQFANGAIYDEEKNHHVLHDIKIEMLKEILEPLNEPVLVAYNFKSDLIRLKKAFPEGQTLSANPQMIKDWNDKKIPLMFTSPASASHGLNLQKGGSIMVWFGLTFNLGQYQQFVARLDRQGQTEMVRNIHLVIKGTMDEKILKAIESKATSQRELMEYIKQQYC